MSALQRVCVGALLAGVAFAAQGGEMKPTPEHPVLSSLEPLGKRRFYVSSRYLRPLPRGSRCLLRKRDRERDAVVRQRGLGPGA